MTWSLFFLVFGSWVCGLATGATWLYWHDRRQIEAQTKPPKPAEPKGLHAVVADRDGGEWVRDRTGGWFRTSTDGTEWCNYYELDVAKVLSEGVS